MIFRCPTNELTDAGEKHTIIGCGKHFECDPDIEGIVDCPHCGIWFEATSPDAVPDPQAAPDESCHDNSFIRIEPE